VSDLHCPARVYVARYGETQGDSLSPLGREQSRQLAASLRGARIARVYTSAEASAVQTAEIVAPTLGVRVVVRSELDASRIQTELELVADQHRGEAVLAISHGRAICTGVPALARNLPVSFAEGRALPSCGVVELEADADGWRAVSWCGEPVMTR
jgi:2,3-bisphosphoglycerate-dependent phosphoglycerate mutase